MNSFDTTSKGQRKELCNKTDDSILLRGVKH